MRKFVIIDVCLLLSHAITTERIWYTDRRIFYYTYYEGFKSSIYNRLFTGANSSWVISTPEPRTGQFDRFESERDEGSERKRKIGSGGSGSGARASHMRSECVGDTQKYT